MYCCSLLPGLVWACGVGAVFAGTAVDMVTQGPFLLPIVESRLCILAIHSPHNNVELRLVHQHDKTMSVTISLAMAKYKSETQISAAGLGDNVTIVSRDKLHLSEQLISLFRIDNVLAVFRAGQVKPVLVYQSIWPVKVNFEDYLLYYTSGPRGAYAVHTTSLGERGYSLPQAAPHGEAVAEELHLIRRETRRRLGIMNAFFKKIQIDKLPPGPLRTIVKVLDSNVMQQLFVLDYYDAKLKGKYLRYRKVVTGKQTDIKARLAGK